MQFLFAMLCLQTLAGDDDDDTSSGGDDPVRVLKKSILGLFSNPLLR